MEKYRIENLDQFIELWTKIYNTGGKPDWSHILPYYSDDIHFRDTIQEIKGINEFRSLVERLTKRSKELEFKIKHAVMNENIIFMEWEMVISFRGAKKSSVYGASRLTLDENGKIIDQRDYYDLWGDIFDNIPGINKLYRKIMRALFG